MPRPFADSISSLSLFLSPSLHTRNMSRNIDGSILQVDSPEPTLIKVEIRDPE